MEDDNIRIFLVGNKSDLEEKRAVLYESGEKKAEAINAFFYETSAKTCDGINELFTHIAKCFISDHIQSDDQALDISTSAKKKKFKC